MVRAWGVSKQRWCDTRVRIFFDGFLAFSFCSTRGAAKATGAAPTQSKPKKRKHADIGGDCQGGSHCGGQCPTTDQAPDSGGDAALVPSPERDAGGASPSALSCPATSRSNSDVAIVAAGSCSEMRCESRGITVGLPPCARQPKCGNACARGDGSARGGGGGGGG